MQNDYETELKTKGIAVFVPGGNSMWPTLKNGGQSVIIVPKTQRLKKYDVALYRTGESYVLHRVMEVTDTGYTMCGDSRFDFEYGIPESAVVGVMQGFYRGRKYISAEDKKSRRAALFLHKHRLIKKIAVKLYYFFRRGKEDERRARA